MLRRRAESAARELSARVHGVSTTRFCRPILDWPHWAVWAYLYAHDLPVHPAYACTLSGQLDRDRLRVHAIGNPESGDRGYGRGRAEWEAHYYPQHQRRSDAL